MKITGETVKLEAVDYLRKLSTSDEIQSSVKRLLECEDIGKQRVALKDKAVSVEMTKLEFYNLLVGKENDEGSEILNLEQVKYPGR